METFSSTWPPPWWAGWAWLADLGERRGLFQPAHGSAPDICGRGFANPTATILSVAMMLQWLGHSETVRGARLIQEAVARVLGEEGLATPDLGGTLSTQDLGDAVVDALKPT